MADVLTTVGKLYIGGGGRVGVISVVQTSIRNLSINISTYHVEMRYEAHDGTALRRNGYLFLPLLQYNHALFEMSLL